MNRTRLAPFALLFVAMVWGVAFVLMKTAIERQPLFDFLAVRFTLAAAIMIAVRPRLFRDLDSASLKRGAILGLLLAGAYVTQTIGLSVSTAAITGFITGLYVVLTPILAWLFFKHRPRPKVFWSAILATVGLGFISIQGLSIELGQIWVLICAVLFAGHIIGLAAWSKGRDAYALTVLQLLMVAAVSWLGAVPNGVQLPVDFDGWFAIVFTALFSTAIAFFVQTWAQGHMEASRVAILLTSEVVFTAVISVAVGQEVLQWKTIVGGLLVVAAMLWVEWPAKFSAGAKIGE